MVKESSTKASIEKHPLYKDCRYEKAFLSIKDLKFKECKRDGNCLYRAISILIFPYLKDNEFKGKFLSFKGKCENAGFNDSVVEWYIESIEELQSKTLHDLQEDDYLLIIAYLRMICSAEAQNRAELYQGFIEQDIKEYCQISINPMNERAGDLEISILANALQIEIKILSIMEEVLQEVTYGQGNIQIKILHTPDHFEPLY